MLTVPAVWLQRAPCALVDEFIELVSGDAALVQEEFEAIVAEEWPGQLPPAQPRLTRQVDEPPSGSHRAHGRSKPMADRSPVRIMRERNRQRSPPAVTRERQIEPEPRR